MIQDANVSDSRKAELDAMRMARVKNWMKPYEIDESRIGAIRKEEDIDDDVDVDMDIHDLIRAKDEDNDTTTTTPDLSSIYEQIKNNKKKMTNLEMGDLIEDGRPDPFAKDENYGYVTSCPSNLGTGMRASVHVKIPKLTSDGTDAKAKKVCNPLGLSVRGTGGEHTPIGADGTVDISPYARLFIKESEIIDKLYEGIEKLMAIENSE